MTHLRLVTGFLLFAMLVTACTTATATPTQPPAPTPTTPPLADHYDLIPQALKSLCTPLP